MEAIGVLVSVDNSAVSARVYNGMGVGSGGLAKKAAMRLAGDD